MLSTLYRWWAQDGVGGLGKTEQVTRGVHRGGAGSLPCQLPPELSARVENLHLGHAGSVAQIFRAWTRDGREAALKVVPSAVGEAVLAETQAADQAGALAGWALGTRIASVIGELNRGLTRELSMRHEREMARRLRAALAEHPHCCVPSEIPELCTDAVYAYEYVHGITAAVAMASSVVDGRHVIADRLSHVFFELLHVHGLLLLDPNLTNVVVGDGALWLIDLGAVAVMDGDQRALLTELHATRGDCAELSRLIGAPPDQAALIADCMAAFWDERREFPDSSRVLGLLTDRAMLAVDVDPAISPLFRATVTLIASLQRAGVTRLRVSAHMERLAARAAGGAGNDVS